MALMALMIVHACRSRLGNYTSQMRKLAHSVESFAVVHRDTSKTTLSAKVTLAHRKEVQYSTALHFASDSTSLPRIAPLLCDLHHL